MDKFPYLLSKQILTTHFCCWIWQVPTLCQVKPIILFLRNRIIHAQKGAPKKTKLFWKFKNYEKRNRVTFT